MEAAIESLNYQGNELHTKITEVVRFLRVDGRYNTDAILESLFSEYVRIRTGINVELVIAPDEEVGYNACVYLPTITKDHPWGKLFMPVVTQSTGVRGIEALKDIKNKATIDLDNSKVGGVFSEIPSKVFIGRKLLSDVSFTAEEVSGIILHEIGHIFTYYQNLNMMAYGGITSLMVARELAGVKDPQQREFILVQAANTLGLDIADVQKTLQAPTQNEVLLLRDYATKHLNASTNPIYDIRNLEQMADHFAVKHGAGKDLASGLVKLLKQFGAPVTAIPYIVQEALNAVVIIGGIVLAGTMPPFHVAGYIGMISAILALGVSVPGIKIYDSPEARIKHLRAMLVQDLARAKRIGDKDLLKQINNQIASIDESAKAIKDRRPILTVFWESIPGFYNKAAKQEKAAKELEALLYNDLHYQSSKFDLLADQTK